MQCDSVVYPASAYADETQFQQLLFSQVFTTEGPHFVSLKAVLTGPNVRGTWLDFDFVTITGDSK